MSKMGKAAVYAIAEALINELQYEEEMDVWFTPDGSLITIHPDVLNRAKKELGL